MLLQRLVILGHVLYEFMGKLTTFVIYLRYYLAEF